MFERFSIEPSVSQRTPLVGEPVSWAKHSDEKPLAQQKVEPLRLVVNRFVGAELEQVERLLRSATSSRYDEVATLCRSAAAMGGKRLRPTLVFLAGKVVGANAWDHRTQHDLSAIAASVELVHAASLVHDDVMDHAVERRHQMTIAGLAGNSAAVLLGDLLFTQAYGLAARCKSTVPARQIAAAATKLCTGELRQQASAGDWSMSRSQYRSLLLQKTGALCGVSCRLGAWRSGGSRSQVKALTNFGNWLGLAFQVFDDWLDYWGTEQVGKTLGTDLAQAKPTLPLIRLLETATPSHRQRLTGLLARADHAAMTEIRASLESSDAAEFTLQMARRSADRAKRYLSELPDSEVRACLSAVADYSIVRDR